MAAPRNERQTPLLSSNTSFYEGCPGCQMEKRKQSKEKPPFKDLSLIALLVLCNALPISSLFPFIYFMVRDFHIASTEDIGYYAGYIGSAFMFGRFLTSVLWGVAADKYGRKPIMLIGVSSVIIFNTLFGLSTTVWMAVSMRFLLGAFNGLLGPVKAYASEICRDEHQALGISVVGTMWGIGLIIGPAIGGFLAQPAEKYPKIFSEESLFGRFPYLLPCLCISIVALIVFITTLWLPETLHKHPLEFNEKFISDIEDGDNGNPSPGKSGQPLKTRKKSWMSLLKSWPVMSSIIIYCVFSLHEVAYTEIFSLWAESPKSYGGLNLSSNDVGTILAITGFGILVFQISFYPPMERKTGAILLTRVSAVTMFTSMFIFLNNSVMQDQRGAANGLSMTAQSLFKTVGPTGGGSLFAWSQKRQDASFLPGDHLVFFLLNVIIAIVFIMTFEPFLPKSTNKPLHLNMEGRDQPE